MTLRCQYCNSREENENEKETMLFIILEDDEGTEQMRVPLYLAADAKNTLPDLKKSFDDLPGLLEMIYNTGKNQENLQFVKEEVEI